MPFKGGRCPTCQAIHDFALKRELAQGKRRVYVFDLDGTLCEPAETMQLQVDPIVVEKTRPYLPRIGVLRRLKAEGHIILIYTARATNQYIPTLRWLAQHDVPHDGLICGKPSGDIYVDDKGVTADDFFRNKGVE